MKNNIKDLTTRDFRANMASHFDSVRSPNNTVLTIASDSQDETIYILGKHELEHQKHAYGAYLGVKQILLALGLSSFKTISQGHTTQNLPLKYVTTITHLFTLLDTIVDMTYTDGPNATFNAQDIAVYMDQSRSKDRDARLDGLSTVIHELFSPFESQHRSLSLGLFIKNMRKGFSIDNILSDDTKQPLIATTFNNQVQALPEDFQKIIDGALLAVQSLLMQPRLSRQANVPYVAHLHQNLDPLLNWYDENILGRKGVWEYKGHWVYK